MAKTGLASIVANGTKVWLDSVDPALISGAIEAGATGATSNPIIIADLIKSGRFDSQLASEQGNADVAKVAWQMTNNLVTEAEKAFLPIWDRTKGNDGYVSFELDPLLEDPAANLSSDEIASRYIALAKEWAADHPNRLIKVPATPGGISALEGMVAAGVNVNVTLIFSDRQYQASRDAVWRGAQQRRNLDNFKSVYSIFVSRVDVYTAAHIPELSAGAQGQVALFNAKKIWQSNSEFWQAHKTPLEQEMVFASTGTKNPALAADYYVAALVGSDIQTNPPATNAAVEKLSNEYSATLGQFPTEVVQEEIATKVDMKKLEEVLMGEGLAKFCSPQKQLLAVVAGRI